jgi:predicted RecB family nuclease
MTALEVKRAYSHAKIPTKLDQLYKSCMSGGEIGKRDVINPSMVLLYTVSPFNLWCDLFAPQEEKDPEPESLKILAKIGNMEERRYIEEAYPGMQRIEVETIQEAFFQVLKGCFERVRAFHSAPLIYLPERLLGIPDVLEKSDDHKSVFGGHHYVIKEKKTTKEPKEKHVLQTALNNYVLGKIQDYTPPNFVILNRDDEEFTFAFNDYASQLQDSITSIREIIRGTPVTPTKGALQEPWKSFGLEKAKEIGDISLVSGIGPTKKELLAQIGIRTISDLMKANISLPKIKGVGPESLAKWRTQATAISQDRIIAINAPPLPRCTTNIFLDFEGTYDLSDLYLEGFGIESNERWANAIYLIGTLVIENGKREYVPYLAESFDGEERILKQFIEFLQSKRDFVIYHYSSYEKTHVKQMLSKYGIGDDFTNAMVDLSPILKKCAVFPTYGYGLKEVANRLGFKWSEQGMDGFLSIAHYLTYLRNHDKAEVQKILKYNEEDCIATTVVKDFLDSLVPQIVA